MGLERAGSLPAEPHKATGTTFYVPAAQHLCARVNLARGFKERAAITCAYFLWLGFNMSK